MCKKTTAVCNRTGLHARPAAQFANAAKQFDSKVFVRNLSKPEVDNLANAKSIISILTLGMGKGTKIEISAEGPDEQEAVDTLVGLVEGGFGEL